METTEKAVAALNKTRDALQQINSRVEPLLRRNRENPNDPTVAAAIALTMGTLRFMGSRLRGMKPSDPLRQQLNQIRTLLRKAQKHQKKQDKETIESTTKSQGGKSAKASSIETPNKADNEDSEDKPHSSSKRKSREPESKLVDNPKKSGGKKRRKKT
jgi:hypothetical protein